MCLTESAYKERYWGPFPSLRKALENKKVPSHYYGLTSADDNFFEAMLRLIEISVLAREYKQHIKEVAQSVGIEKMQKDLQSLRDAIKSASYFFSETIRDIEELESTLYDRRP